MKRLLITGAAGGLGRMARRRLSHLADVLRLSDIAELGPAAENEEIVQCDLGDKAATEALVAGCDGIVHLGGISVEDKWSGIRNANIDGLFNLYEGARRNGMPRIVFASSNHVIGYHRQDTRLDARAQPLPDSLYGVSKSFGEALASMYHSKFGQQTAIVRIGSCTPEPRNHRMLATWLSHDDFVSLIECVFRAPRLGCPVIYGASANTVGWWDNSHVAYLGWRPRDDSEVYRAKLDATLPRPAEDAPQSLYQGGDFTSEPIHDED